MSKKNTYVFYNREEKNLYFLVQRKKEILFLEDEIKDCMIFFFFFSDTHKNTSI